MTREEEIKRASIMYHIYQHDNSYKEGETLDFYIKGFIEGAKWADKHPNLESIWHDASEEPLLEEKEIIFLNPHGVAYIAERFGGTFSYMLEDCYWEKFVNILRISKWAYVSDLLPKGDEYK